MLINPKLPQHPMSGLGRQKPSSSIRQQSLSVTMPTIPQNMTLKSGNSFSILILKYKDAVDDDVYAAS